MIIWLSPLIVWIVGLILFILSCKAPESPNTKTIGLHMFWVGLLAWLLVGLQHFIGIGVVTR